MALEGAECHLYQCPPVSMMRAVTPHCHCCIVGNIGSMFHRKLCDRAQWGLVFLKKKMMKRQRPLPFCSKTTFGWSLASCSKTMFTSRHCDRTIRLHTAHVVMWHNARRFSTASSSYDEPHQSVPAFQPLHHAHILFVCVFFQVRLLFAPPGLAGLEDDNSLSAVRLLFLFSASFPPPPAVPPSLPPPFSLSRSRSLSRVLLVFSDIFTEELLPEETDRKVRHEGNVSWTPQTSGS